MLNLGDTQLAELERIVYATVEELVMSLAHARDDQVEDANQCMLQCCANCERANELLAGAEELVADRAGSKPAWLELVDRPRDGRSVMEAAVNAAAAAFTVPFDHVMGRTKTQPAAFARQVAFWLLREVLGWSSCAVGKLVGRDHGTILHAVNRVRDICSTSANDCEKVTAAKSRFIAALNRN